VGKIGCICQAGDVIIRGSSNFFLDFILYIPVVNVSSQIVMLNLEYNRDSKIPQNFCANETRDIFFLNDEVTHLLTVMLLP